MSVYLFILCPPYSGSTLLWRLLQTSPNVSHLPVEGQHLDAVEPLMRADPWNTERPYPWEEIKAAWDAVWDHAKPVLLEKSPPEIARAFEIERVFAPCAFLAMIRNPYATCEGLCRRRETPPMEGTAGLDRGDAFEHAARLWVRFADYQVRNIEGLTRILHFTYERLTAEPSGLAEEIVRFLPELGKLKPGRRFRVHAIGGSKRRRIADLNPLKIANLEAADIARIDRVLAGRPDLMAFFGYEYLGPAPPRP